MIPRLFVRLLILDALQFTENVDSYAIDNEIRK